MPDIGEIASGPDHVLSATITVEDEVRAFWMPPANPADPFGKVAPLLCSEGQSMRYFAGAASPYAITQRDDEGNEQPATVILSDTANYGGQESGAVRWARLAMERLGSLGGEGEMRETNLEALPPACGRCAHYNGLWAIGPWGGVQRCGCARGRALSRLDARQGG